MKARRTAMILGALLSALLCPAKIRAITFDRIVVFGTSLSDPGNAFALTGQAISAPYSGLDAFLIPSAPYNIGGHHFSNGATWIEQLGRQLDLGDHVRAAFADSDATAMNYAIGGARARDDGLNLNFPHQVAVFLNDVADSAPADAVYVIEVGANDVRDALVAGSPVESAIILGEALSSIGARMADLYVAGARKFLVLNAPDLGVLPSIKILDTIVPGAVVFGGYLAQLFNAQLDGVLANVGALPGVEIARLNVYDAVNAIVANPAGFGLEEVARPCISPDAQPFSCRRPDRYLFWDGVHPTRAVHSIFAKEAAAVLNR